MIDRQVFSDCPALRVVVENEPAFTETVERLFEHGQARMFGRYLCDAEPRVVREALLSAGNIDLGLLEKHRCALNQGKQSTLCCEDVEPINVFTNDKQAGCLNAQRTAGDALLARGEVASIAFAGGAGTRFFSELGRLRQALQCPNEVLACSHPDPDDPKGVFPISPVGGLSFFEIFIAEALEVGFRLGRLPLVMLMTSSITHERTLKFLEDSELWGFPREGCIVFIQAHLPRLDRDGLLIVADDQGRLSLTGDGHGGVYNALIRPASDGHSLLDKLKEQGIRHLVMYNIDNPVARPFEPCRLGYHEREEALFTASVVRKIVPTEKVGVFMKVRKTGRVEVVEYNMLDPQLATERDPFSDRLRYDAANVNVNVIAVSAVRSDLDPILYRDKEVPARTGPVASSSMEYLNQHITRLLPCEKVRAYEVSRDEFFMPTKNVVGVDSVVSTVSMLSAMHARRLIQCGASVAQNALCDLHPCCGDDPELLRRRGIGVGWCIDEGARLYLCVREGAKLGEPPLGRDLHLEPKSTLIIDATRPYGAIQMTSDRRIVCDLSHASRVSLGAEVRIKSGIRVALRIKPGGRLVITDGRVFDRDLEITVAENQECNL